MPAEYAQSFTKMHPILHAFSLAISVGFAYWWLTIPALNFYSLQAFAIACLIYFVLKAMNRGKIWHLMPTETSLEMVVATFAIMLLIGSTGNMASPLYALSYIHLFLLVFSSGYRTSLGITGVIMLFHIGLHSELTIELLGRVMTLPVIMFFFLFAKSQYEEAVRERGIIAFDEQSLADQEKQTEELERFLSQFIIKKIMQLRSLAQDATINQQAILGQISLLEIEVERILSKRRIHQREKEQAITQTQSNQQIT